MNLISLFRRRNRPTVPVRRLLAAALSAVLLFAAVPCFCVRADYGYDLPWLWPVPGSYRINCLDYYYNGGIHNAGQCIDIGANGYTGTERLDIVSATTGTVLYIQDKYNETDNRGSGWGNYVIVQSGGINIVYGHLKTVSCGYGEIKAGDVIGKMGNTGNSTGVHLHLQAYPASEGSGSAAIPVFERFRTNPLYYEKFEFLKGLEKESVRYRDWISTYYKTLKSSYYTYSGGLTEGLPTTPVSAVVSVINTSGAPIRSLPVPDNSYITETVSYGGRAEISGWYRDAYDSLWLALADGRGWLKAVDVGFREYVFSTSAEEAVVPKGEYGAFRELPFGGVLRSKNRILSYTAVLRSEEGVAASCTVSVGAQTASLELISERLGIEELDDGRYTFSLSVREEASYPGADPEEQTAELITSEFSINEAIADKIPPLLEKFEISSLTAEEIRVVCIASDNKQMAGVTVTVKNAGSQAVGSYPCTEANGRYETVIPVSEIGGSGVYTLTATAEDAYRNTDSAERTLTVPAGGLSEVWKANFALKVRDGAGLSHTHIGAVKKGQSMTVTEVAEADGYLWGKHAAGWSPLIELPADPYADYVSGWLYSVSFDLNGGTGELPSALNKRYGVEVSIPTGTPEKTGYEFLGWARDSGAKEPEYRPGDPYAENASAVLFAVWGGDTTPPEISEVTAAPTEWTNGDVTLTVKANDNTGTVYFSFDGGKTWQAEGVLELKENTVFPVGQIMVRDPSGNITRREQEITISNIDKAKPDLSAASCDISVSGTNVTFTVRGATDTGSGIAAYEIVYASDREMTEPAVMAIESGKPVTLANGVYYWRLRVTDHAGNIAERAFDRFRVGEAERLPTPGGLKVTETASSSATLTWDAVGNADSYRLEVSLNDRFTDAVAFTVKEPGCRAEGLEAGKTYYYRLSASTEDGIYLTSAWSETGRFVTLSNDCSIHGFDMLKDAVIDDEEGTVTYTAPYAAQTLDLTATVHSGAKTAYFSDPSFLIKLPSVSAYPFTGNSATVYLRVTAENGESADYTVTVTRAGEKAAAPVIEFDADAQELSVGEAASALTLTASSPDGGRITVEWYMTLNDGGPQKIGDGLTVTPLCPTAGSYRVYAVVRNTNEKCRVPVTSVNTESVVITVSKRTSPLSVSCGGYAYNGNTPVPAASGYVGDGAVSFRFFSDADCRKEIAPPTDAGTYYVKAYAAETDRYLQVESQAVSFTISKAANPEQPDMKVVQPSLRDRHGYITVTSEGVEYRTVGGKEWTPAGKEALSFPEGTAVELRFAETGNYQAGVTVKVVLAAFAGASDIVPEETSGMYVKGELLFLIADGMTADEVLAGLKKSGGVKLYAADGTLLNGTDKLVGTGASIRVEDDQGIYKAMTVILLGDLDGDGLITADDARRILMLSNGMAASESEYDLPAGDLDGDGKLTSADAYLALRKEEE